MTQTPEVATLRRREPRSQRERTPFYGWRIVGSGMALSALTAALIGQGFSAYAVLLREEFGWGTGLIALAFALQRAESGLIGPFQGTMIDRYGPRCVIALGSIVTACGFVLFSQVNSVWQFLIFYPMISIGVSLCGFLTVVTTIVAWFERRRSTALALYSAGFAIGGLAMPGVFWYLERFGWRAGAMTSAVLMVVVALPLSLMFHHRPSDVGQSVDGETLSVARDGAHATPRAREHFTAAEAIRTRAFWYLSLGHTCAMLVVTVILTHLALHLTGDQGLTLQQASWVIGALPLLQIIGQFAGGYLGDRFDKRLLATGCMVGHVVGLFVLAFGRGTWAVLLFLPLHGIAWGLRAPLMQAMRADYFGSTAFGKILGYSSLVMMVGSIASTTSAGVLNDITGSYAWGFTIVAIAASAGIFFFYFAKPPPPPVRSGQVDTIAHDAEPQES